MRVSFATLGCKVNSYETQALMTLFETHRYDVVPFKEYADVYVINTCSVTNQSDVKSRKLIRQALRRNSEAVVAVIGCYAQLKSDEILAIDGVDIVMGTQDRMRLLEHVEKVLQDRQVILDVHDVSKSKTFDRLNVTHFKEQTRAYVKIQDGCQMFCTFCIIPFARGPMRSRPIEEILKEIHHLVEEGYREVVLTGIHTGGYGLETKQFNLIDLIDAILEHTAIERLRISSIEFNQVTPDLIERLQHEPRMAQHLHIPLQSGSSRILKRMRRRYDVDTYVEAIKCLQQALPNVLVTTDLIVGFPGETDADFEETLNTLKHCQFYQVHVFPYSKRSGTQAALMPDHLSKTVKSFRVNQVLHLSHTMQQQHHEKRKNQPLDVILEQFDEGIAYGHSSEYIYVACPVETFEKGQRISVVLENSYDSPPKTRIIFKNNEKTS